MLPLIISLYDRQSNQYNFKADGKGLRVIKTLFGGEDKTMSFDLPKSLDRDYREIGYGNMVELRMGLSRLFLGEQRDITQYKKQNEERINIFCPGYHIFLEEDGYGDKGKLWADTRYGKWEPTTQDILPTRGPDRNRMDTDNRLYLAPQAGEVFGSPLYYSGSLYFRCPYDEIKRVTFDYDVFVPGNWKVNLQSWTAGFGASVELWSKTNVGEIGNADITLAAERPIIELSIFYNAGKMTFDGALTSCKKFDAPVYTDYTVEAQAGDTVVLNGLGGAGDFLYIGSDRTVFSAIKFNIGADENVNASVMTAQYWNGAWAALAITDGTTVAGNTLNRTGDVAFDRPTDWIPVAVDGVTCWWVRLLFSNALSDPTGVRQIKTDVHTGDVVATITNLQVFGSVDVAPTSSDVAGDIVDQVQAGTPISSDKSLITTINLVLIPLVFEREETCLEALGIVSFYGDAQHKLLGWGVEGGGDRVFIRKPDYTDVRYIVHPSDAKRLLRQGTTRGDYLTEGWGKYRDDEGQVRYTVKYYAHVTPTGIVANTTATGDDLASTVFGVKKSLPIDFGPMTPATAVDAIQQYLIEHAHPLITSSIEIFYSVRDLQRGGAEIHPLEMETGYLVQIPWFRAVEVEGIGTADVREWETTFLLIGYEYDHDRGSTRLFPEEAEEDLERLLAYVRDIPKTLRREY